MRLIDADAFIEEARNRIDMQDEYLPIHIKEFVIDEMPTIEAEPIKYGKWIEGRDIHGFWDKCSCCGTTIRYDIDKYSRCPSCGAKMEGEEE